MAHNDTHAARKKGGAGRILLVVLLLLLLAAGAAVRFAYNEIHGNGAPGSTEVTVSIPQGSGVATIANKLKEAGVIRSAYLFRWYVGEKGAAGKLQYGDFVLQTSAISYDAIIATLSQYAKAETVRVSILSRSKNITSILLRKSCINTDRSYMPTKLCVSNL